MELLAYTSPTGGTGRWIVDPLPINSLGKVVLDDMTPNVGVTYVEARFSGTMYFAPSASSRFKVTVNARTPSVTMTAPVSLAPGDALAIGYAVSPADARGGILELLVDGSPYASKALHFELSGTWSVANEIEPGPHSIRLRMVPSHPWYGPGLSALQTLTVGGFATNVPVISYDRFSTMSRNVVVNAPSSSGGMSVINVRVSNTSSVSGGLLTDGINYAWQPAISWILPSGADGQRSVWMQLQRNDGSWTAAASDSIYLDTTAPVSSFVINGNAARVGDPWGGSLYDQTLTGSATDASLALGATLSRLALSNDGAHWSYQQFTGDASSFELQWQVALSAFGYDGEDGLKTVYLKWRDAAGNWSQPATDTIELIHGRVVGRVLVDGEAGYGVGDGYVGNATVTLTFPIDYPPAEGMDRVTIRGAYDGTRKVVAWQPGLAVSWSLTSSTFGYTTSDGVKRVWVELFSKTGREREIGTMVILDRAIPTTGTPRPIVELNSVVDEVATTSTLGTQALTSGTPAVAATIKWTGSDNGSVASYRLQRSLNATTWSSVTLANPAVPAYRQVMKPATTYAFRARAVDDGGNLGTWRLGPTFKMLVRQETSTSIVYSGTWRTETRADAFGGTLRSTSAQGASARLTFTGRSVAWVAPRATSGDAADVYIDGVRVKTVYLSLGTGYFARRVVFSYSWSSVGTHTIRIVKKYANTNLMPLDGFIVLN